MNTPKTPVSNHSGHPAIAQDRPSANDGGAPVFAASPNARPRWAVVAGWFAGVFGIVSVFSGGAVLFVGGAFTALAGSIVPFVVWFNFLAGFAYVAAAIGLVRWRPWATPLSAVIAGLTLLVFAAFGIHVLSGGEFEARTVGALALRTMVWVGIAVALAIKRHR